MTGIKDVARRAGVSIATVSNVLNRPDRVAPETRDRVQRAIDELAYVPNTWARQLLGAPSRTVGLIVLDIANPFYSDLMHGVQEVVTAADLAVILCSSDHRPDKEADFIKLMQDQRVGGLLVTPAGDVGGIYQRMSARGCPVVLLDRHADRGDYCSAAADNEQGGELAVRHLLGLGHRRLAFVRGKEGIRQHEKRHVGALHALAEAGEPASGLVLLVSSEPNVAGGRDAALRFLGLSPRPTGVICCNDMFALGMLQVLVAHGVRVPEDVAVVGYDDIEFAGAATIPITSVRQPRHQIGRSGTDLLLREIEDVRASSDDPSIPAHEHHQILFAPELVARASSVART